MPEKSKPPGGRAPDARIEGGRFSEEEILGLDKPSYELRTHEESEFVQRVPYELYKAGSLNLEKINRLLALYELNSRTYDERDNPLGLAMPLETRTQAIEAGMARMALLYMLKVPDDISRGLFGVAYMLKQRGENKLSPAFEKVLAGVTERRARYPLEHSSNYPTINKILSKIEQITGFTSLQLFKPGSIPPLHPTPRQKNTLEEHLYTYSLLVSGTLTRADISERAGQSSLVHKILDKNQSPFTQEVIEFARKKLREAEEKDME